MHVKSDCALTTLRVLPDFRQSDHTPINGLTKLGQLLCFLLSLLLPWACIVPPFYTMTVL